MQVASPIQGNKAQLYLIAKGRDLDINALQKYKLDFEFGIGAGNSVPLLIRIFRKTGSISLASIDINLDSEIIKRLDYITLNRIGSTNKQLLLRLESDLNLVAFPCQGEYTVTVNTINESAATIDIEIFGFKLG